MIMRDLSIFWYLLQFLSSLTCSFHHGSLFLAWLELPKIFYIVWSHYERCCFPISFLVSFLLVYWRTTDFCELLLSSATVQKVFINCRSSMVEFLGSLIYTILSSTNNYTFTFSFSVCIPLISFNCLIALARILRYHVK